MKNRFKITNLLVFLCFSLVVSFASCEDAKNDIIDENKAYFKDASINKFEDVFLENVETKVALPINLTQKAEGNVKVKISYSEEALKKFNEKYNKEYVLYPIEQWNLDSSYVTINAGTSVASLGLTIKPLTKELKASGSLFVIPLVITEVEGAGLFPDSNGLIYVLKQVPYADVPVISSGKYINFKWATNSTSLKDFTIEFLMNIDIWKNLNNQTLFMAFGSTGRQIYTRLENGGSGIKNADFEVNFGNGVYLNSRPASGVFEPNRWYHIAFVVQAGKLVIYIDGVAVAQREVPNEPIQLDLNTGGFGESNLTSLAVSELRIWSIPRSQGQIKESMYTVNPQTEGLASYWRLNEGEGNTFKDFTNKNPAATSKSAPIWRFNERLEIK